MSSIDSCEISLWSPHVKFISLVCRTNKITSLNGESIILTKLKLS